jgi:hypothetical protein
MHLEDHAACLEMSNRPLTSTCGFQAAQGVHGLPFVIGESFVELRHGGGVRLRTRHYILKGGLSGGGDLEGRHMSCRVHFQPTSGLGWRIDIPIR